VFWSTNRCDIPSRIKIAVSSQRLNCSVFHVLPAEHPKSNQRNCQNLSVDLLLLSSGCILASILRRLVRLHELELIFKPCSHTNTSPCRRVPPTSSAIRRTRRRRRLAGSTIRMTIRRALLKTRNPTRPGETSSGRTVVMGCPRSVHPPIGLCRSKLSNTKNTDE
jgi:hypothetical protein